MDGCRIQTQSRRCVEIKPEMCSAKCTPTLLGDTDPLLGTHWCGQDSLSFCGQMVESWCVERVKVQTRQAPAPPGPFRHLQLDYITLPKCEGHKDVLVGFDRFSRFVEAYPTKN